MIPTLFIFLAVFAIALWIDAEVELRRMRYERECLEKDRDAYVQRWLKQAPFAE